ncbi:MAG: methyltransferase domain-containing protein [Rhodocyclaceae bacterium]
MLSGAAKPDIRRAFGDAARRYDAAATVQRSIADALLAHAQLSAGAVVLDAGCGTGYGLRALRRRTPDVHAIGLDAAHAMLAQAGGGVCADLESLPLRNASIDHYWSSLAWQWTQPQRAIAEAARVLRSAGRLEVATLGPHTLDALRAAFDQADDAEHVRDFTAPEAYADWLAQAGFHDITVHRQDTIVHAPDLRSILRGLRDIGAHALGKGRRRGLLGRAAWSRIEDHYESLRTDQGLPVRYDVVYLLARRAP